MQKPNGYGTYGAMKKAMREGRTDLDGSPVDFRGQLAIMEARSRGIHSPNQLRAIAREAKS